MKDGDYAVFFLSQKSGYNSEKEGFNKLLLKDKKYGKNDKKEPYKIVPAKLLFQIPYGKP